MVRSPLVLGVHTVCTLLELTEFVNTRCVVEAKLGKHKLEIARVG